jgi:hypothetical protein
MTDAEASLSQAIGARTARLSKLLISKDEQGLTRLGLEEARALETLARGYLSCGWTMRSGSARTSAT